MALVSAGLQRPESVPAMERSNSKSASNMFTSSTDTSPDRNFDSNSSTQSQKDAEIQSEAALRSEEYRQLFRLPLEEVLVEDFNCAFQENILIQGHMYLFVHHICFYSNIFGFETKKIIPFQEVTSVRRAKTAGIFPNAIEIAAGDKKYFFASFLSRDEAFKLINEGWLQYGNAVEAVAEKQESVTGNSQDNRLVTGNSQVSAQPVHEVDISERNETVPNLEHSAVPPSLKDDSVSTSPPEFQSETKEDTPPVPIPESSAQGEARTWAEENIDAPKIPESYTKLTESKFPVKVEEFFRLFISDEAANFTESFHKKCGDIEYKCSPWRPNKDGGHLREVSFGHPVKIYIGAKFGSCKEVEKFRVYRDSHLVIEKSQEINDVPYGDYFRVEGIWDVHRDSSEPSESCVLRTYVNVAFFKKTMFKGKIEQSTIEECRGVYSLWNEMAHELLKQKNIEREAKENRDLRSNQNREARSERGQETQESSERSNSHTRTQPLSNCVDTNQQVSSPDQGSLNQGTSVASHFGELLIKLCSTPRNQKLLPLLLAITFVVLLLMQLSILVLLSRPQHIHMSYPVGHGTGTGSIGVNDQYEAQAWLEKRLHYLKDEILAVETRIERMQHEHLLLKAQLKDLERLAKRR